MKRFTILAATFVALLTTSTASAQQYSVAVPNSLVPFSSSDLILGIEFGSGEMQFSLSFATLIPEKMTLPKKPADLDDDVWEEQEEKAPNRCTFKNKNTGLIIHFDKAVEGADGWKGKDHWHVRNPNWKKGDGDTGFYVDVDGIPTNKKTEKSHIKPDTEITLPVKNDSTTLENTGDVENIGGIDSP